MSTLVKKQTAELVGAQLGWAVAIADGKQPTWFEHNYPIHTVRINNKPFCPWCDWQHGGPIIERRWLDIVQALHERYGFGWVAVVAQEENKLVLFMRAFVESELGGTVEVPE